MDTVRASGGVRRSGGAAVATGTLGMRPAPVPPAGRFPFPAMDEYSRHLLQEQRDADTVHLEAHLPGAVDPDRLGAALAEVLADHPLLLVRQSAPHWWHRRYHWEPVPPGPAPVRTGTDLDGARGRALGEPPPLSEGPPLRLEAVALPGGGTALLLTLAHTLADAGTGLRLLCDLADRYRHPGATRSAPAPAAASALVRRSPQPVPARSAPRAARPARIAPPSGLVPAPGMGLCLVGTTVPPRSRYTVNDLLLTAVQLSLSAWNLDHGRRAGPIVLSMPVDDRPHGPLAAGAPMGNHNHLATVRAAAPARERDPLALLARTSAQAAAARAVQAGGPGAVAALVSSPLLPVGVKAPLTRALRAAASPWTSTALVSNLGRVAHPLDFGPGAGRAEVLWFSAPVRMPRGLAVSALALDGRLHLAFRYCRRLLDGPAAAELAGRCLESLDRLVLAVQEEERA